jgi:regulation of enolase protein 1 (concanavalin A-like superfamily)
MNTRNVAACAAALLLLCLSAAASTSRHPVIEPRSSASPESPILAALPAWQTGADVGAPAIAGSASFSDGRYTVRGSGADIGGSSDQFHYVYQAVNGDVDIIARVVSLQATGQWPKAGVMIRETLAANSRHALAFSSPTRGYAFQWRTTTGGGSTRTSGGAGTAPGWVRLIRKGNVFSAYRSTNGTSWAGMGTATFAMNETVYVGIAVTSNTVAAATTAVVDNLRLTWASTPANDPPAVILSAPANGAKFVAPATVTLTASAADPDGSIASVDFYANAALVGRDTLAPYSVVGSLPQGTFAITASALDNQGASTVSDPVSITVSAAVGAPRAVAFTASPDHATLVIRYVFEVYAQGATPGVSKPIATLNLGKPIPTATGEVTVDCSAFFQALQPATYIAAVVAVGDGGSSRSAGVIFTR